MNKRAAEISAGWEDGIYRSLPLGPIVSEGAHIASALSVDDGRAFYVSGAFRRCEWCGTPQLLFDSVLCVRCERFRPWEIGAPALSRPDSSPAKFI